MKKQILQDLQQSIKDLKGLVDSIQSDETETEVIKSQIRGISLNIKENLDELIAIL